ncbi:hypothetical protein [Deinococcus hopiensis]|uniref:hypothetical protein n=1 Tax=Deinococcus hopiensis TaxID=309885 RepID=UPI00111C15A0|nr:hypothetical protein [Deinococcus hopiensis]
MFAKEALPAIFKELTGVKRGIPQDFPSLAHVFLVLVNTSSPSAPSLALFGVHRTSLMTAA